MISVEYLYMHIYFYMVEIMLYVFNFAALSSYLHSSAMSSEFNTLCYFIFSPPYRFCFYNESTNASKEEIFFFCLFVLILFSTHTLTICLSRHSTHILFGFIRFMGISRVTKSLLAIPVPLGRKLFSKNL